MTSSRKLRIPWIALGSTLLLLGVAGAAYGLYRFKQNAHEAAAQAAAAMPEPREAIGAQAVTTRDHARRTTAIGTARALRSIELRNELPGTVAKTSLATGKLVKQGEILVELDVAVEEAQLASLRAEARLAETMLGRMERALSQKGASAADVDRARAQRDMAVAQVQRLEAVIEQKRLRAPFDARVGLVDLHAGEYLESGTRITSLQGIASSIHIDFSLPQDLAERLQPGGHIEVIPAAGSRPVPASIVALDARVDATTRNTRVRAELKGPDLEGIAPLPRPGASVRVRVPVTEPRQVMVVPVDALRRSPAGNYVFVIKDDPQGQPRAHQQPVTSGMTLGNEVIIESGLEPGQLVATAGSFKLWDKVLVQVRSNEKVAEAKDN